MGRPKIKIIDDSKPEVEEKKKPSTHPSFGGKKKAQKETIDDRGIEDSTLKMEGGELKEEVPSSTINPQDTTIHPQSSTVKKVQKPGRAKPRSKKYQEISKDLDRSKTYPIPEAVDMVKKLNYAKFNGTLEAHINTAQTGIRGLISLPYASGRKLRILVFGHLPEPSEKEGLVLGDDSIIEAINQGKVDFDLVITTPDWMPKLAKVARILGPRGLMPNPKNGTIAEDIKKAVASFQAGKTEFKTESKAPLIHLALGKLDQPTEELTANVKTLLQTIGKTKIKKVTLSPTMGPSVKVDPVSF